MIITKFDIIMTVLCTLAYNADYKFISTASGCITVLVKIK